MTPLGELFFEDLERRLPADASDNTSIWAGIGSLGSSWGLSRVTSISSIWRYWRISEGIPSIRILDSK